METELKPCPFCGEEAKYENTKDFAFVRCKNIFCRVAGPAIRISDEYAAKPRAIEEWNSRAEDGKTD